MPKIKHHTSRRVPPLKDSDFDHEIKLVDHSALIPRTQSPEDEALRASISGAGDPAGPSSSSQEPPSLGRAALSRPERETNGVEVGKHQDAIDNDQLRVATRPSVEVEEPTPFPENPKANSATLTTKSRPKTPLSAIDILYENQRGGFLCGMPLFSSKALGNLDPPPWTNFAHKPSPTDIKTAQVPDPSWEWAWPEWKVNHDKGVDEEGWEYSFMFSKKFSWHGPKWWNSFVRRRAWIRKRAKKDSGYMMLDGNMLTPEYFTVRRRRASVASHSRSPSKADSHRTSKASIAISQVTDLEVTQRPDIEDIESLLLALRTSRIDREKIEAIDNYLEHAGDDIVHLQDEMHEVMSLFVFQASRRVLLTRLTQIYDETQQLLKQDGDSPRLRGKVQSLAEAVKHADEEVRRLEYWSDVKGVAVEGGSVGAVDGDQGWDARWQGVDKSGPAGPAPKTG